MLGWQVNASLAIYLQFVVHYIHLCQCHHILHLWHHALC